MKKAFFSLFLIFAVLPAFAATEKTIAQRVMSIGFRPPDSPASITLTVGDLGNVVKTSKYDGGRIEQEALATLSAPVLNRIKAKIAAVKPGKLIDPNPNQPICMDAPNTNYEVAMADGSMTAVGANEQCKDLVKEGYPMADSEIVEILNGLWTLAY